MSKLKIGIISFFIILFVVGTLSYYSGIYSPLAILGEIFFLVCALDMVGFIPKIPTAIPFFDIKVIEKG